MFEGRKVLWVAGGRDYDDRITMQNVLWSPMFSVRYDMLITGAARGADLLAESVWRDEVRLPYVGVPARWKEHNKAAGAIRNRVIGDEYPDTLLLFPGGKGTSDARRVAEERGIEVVYAEEVR